MPQRLASGRLAASESACGPSQLQIPRISR
jgi:hypothetical protein